MVNKCLVYPVPCSVVYKWIVRVGVNWITETGSPFCIPSCMFCRSYYSQLGRYEWSRIHL